MGEILKLKVSPKGQITLPKKVRDRFFIRNHVYIEIKGNKIELKPVSFEDELEELIIIDLKQKGYSAEQINTANAFHLHELLLSRPIIDINYVKDKLNVSYL